jgi:hypothetical protein
MEEMPANRRQKETNPQKSALVDICPMEGHYTGEKSVPWYIYYTKPQHGVYLLYIYYAKPLYRGLCNGTIWINACLFVDEIEGDQKLQEPLHHHGVGKGHRVRAALGPDAGGEVTVWRILHDDVEEALVEVRLVILRHVRVLDFA